jgi:hypothetical protein
MIETFQSIPLVDPESREGQSFLREVVADLVGFEALGIPPLAGGAEIFPDEGLDHVLNKVPRATAAIQTTYYLGLFTGSTATTVPARTDTLAAAPASVAEPSGGAYARVAVANTDWGAIATNGVGRRTTSAQKSFPPSTGAWGISSRRARARSRSSTRTSMTSPRSTSTRLVTRSRSRPTSTSTSRSA